MFFLSSFSVFFSLPSLKKNRNKYNSSQHQLEAEIRSLPELCRLLGSLQTARDFLLETGGRTSDDLVLLLRRLHLYQGEGELHVGGPLRGLKVCHVDHLIDFLWFIRAKRMIRNRQNVFEQVDIVLNT